MATAHRAADDPVVDPLDKGLRRGALGLFSSVVIGLASTAPAYGLAAAVPALSEEVGVFTPGVLLLAALPMLLVALAFRELNLHEPDSGTTFAWVSRAFGPRIGWLGGWAVVVSCLLVMGSLAQVAAAYAYLLVGAEGLAGSRPALLVGGLAWLALLTWICSRGILMTARLQAVLLLAELAILAVFSVVALVRALAGSPPEGATAPSLALFNPLGAGSGALAAGLLLAVFLYWGWDSSFSVNEETRSPTRVPGIAALTAMAVLVLVFVLVALAVVAYAGPERAAREGGEDVFAAFATSVLGGPGSTLLVVAVLTSATASTQTTILPTARTLLAMGAFGALPAAFARISPRYASPTVATWAVGAASAALLVLFLAVSENALADSVEATALAICFYYALTSAAVPWYFRGHLRGARNLLMRAVLPTLAAASMTVLFVASGVVLADAEESESNVLGLGTPVVVALAALGLGVGILAAQHRRDTTFFAGPLAGPGDEVGDSRVRLRE